MKLGLPPLISAAIFFFGSFGITSCTPAPPPPQARAGQVKLSIAEPGLYRITQEELAKNGLAISSDNMGNVLATHHSQPVPVEIEKDGNAPSILFYALPDESPYSAADVFWLSASGKDSSQIQPRRVTAELNADPAKSFSDTVQLNPKKLYSPDPIDGAHWFWQALTAPTSQTITATLTSPASASGHLDLSLAGVTNGTHQVSLSLNGLPLGSMDWQGRAGEHFQKDITNLLPGENALVLSLLDAGNTADVIYLDALTLNYPREYVAQNNTLDFLGTDHNYQARGFTGNDIRLYDITDPAAVQVLQGSKITQDSDGTSRIAFHDDLTNRHYLALTGDAYKSPNAIQQAIPNTLRSTDQQADYLIIAPAQFDDALGPLAKLRNDKGLRVKIIDIEQVYDAFSDGVQDPHALRDFIPYARDQWRKPAPRYVLLVGKASYDYHDYLNAPNENLVPTMLVPTLHLGEAASDNWFVAASEDDAHPTIAIGRIPAMTVDQVKTAVAKTLAYEAQPQGADWLKRALFVTDDKEPDFDTGSNTMVQALPATIAPQKVYLSAFNGNLDSARAKILEGWNAGSLLTTYIGHGSIDTWAEGPLISAQDVSSLTNGERLSILLTPTCLDGFFYHPERNSLAEDALFNAKGGIVAGLVPTGLSLTEDQDLLMKALMDELFVKRTPTLGQAVMNAKQKMEGQNAGEREILDTFTLLGDPALKWDPPQ